MKIKVNGLDKIRAFVYGFSKTQNARMEKVVKLISYSIERESKISATELKAVDTGLMRSTIYPVIKGSGVNMSGIIGPKTNYAYFVHEGLGTSRGYGRRPFMEIGARKTVESKAQEVADLINKDISKLIRNG